MTENEIAVLCCMFFCAGLYLGTQLKHLKSIRDFIAEKLIYRLWLTLETDSIKCYSGEIVFVENCEIESGVSDNGKENSQQ